MEEIGRSAIGAYGGDAGPAACIMDLETQKAFRDDAADGVAAGRQKSRNHAGPRELPHFTASDLVLNARMTRHGRHHTFVREPTGP